MSALSEGVCIERKVGASVTGRCLYEGCQHYLKEFVLRER